MPLSIAAMIVLAFPFVFGTLRSSSAGKRTVLAAIIGISFQLINQLVANLGLMLDLNPLITTLGPVALILLLASLMIRRAH